MASGIFDVIGPVMIGPSSSHTAGAARIGLAVNKMLHGEVLEAEITLYNSFAETGKGHGTDMALIGGLLGYDADNKRLPHSFEDAEAKGLKYTFKEKSNTTYHPNTAKIKAKNETMSIEVRASSVGGGTIEIDTVNRFDVNVSCQLDTIIFSHRDRPGVLKEITAAMGELDINIAAMHVSRVRKGGEAVTVIEVDTVVTEEIKKEIQELSIVDEFLFIPKIS